MEQFRLILAVVLSILVFLVWNVFFMPKTPVAPPEAPIDQPAGQSVGREQPPSAKQQPFPERSRTPDGGVAQKAPGVKQPDQRSTGDVAGAAIPEPKPMPEAASVVVDTPLYTAEFTERGAVVKRFALKKYKESAKPDSPQKELISSEANPYGFLGIDLAGAGLSDLETGRYRTPSAGEHFHLRENSRTLVFSRTTDKGVVVEKRFIFFPDSYLIKLEVLIDNGSTAPLTGNLGVVLSKWFSGKGGRFVFEGPSALVNQHVTEVKQHKIKETSLVPGPIEWMAMQSRYFMAAVIPENIPASSSEALAVPEKSVMRLSETTPADETDKSALVRAQFVCATTTIPPNTTQRDTFKVFIGPKSIPILKQAGRNLEKAVNFGWFDIVARPCLWLMNFIYRFIPNYGVAIIIVTLVIKLLFWPLGNKSYKSMGEMKKLQPLMAEIREKYKGDKKKMNEEMMGLYKTYKINPLGGCLPMVVQIPVFIAFYRMLYMSIELRHAPFMFWVHDLSAPERLFSFNVAIPFMQPPYGIPVMTIIMGATMFLQQKLQPAPGDPSQAKIMMFMPIMMTFIFINFPSGLVLYFIVNNLISIAQQYYITNKTS